MRVLAVVHQDDAGPGVFADAVAGRGSLEVWRPDREPGPRPVGHDPDAVMIFGGAMDAHEEERHPWLRREKQWIAGLLERRVPVLGVCLGAQLLAEAAGGEVRRAAEPEIGWHQVVLEPAARADPLIGPLGRHFTSFQWHSYEALPPAGSQPLARSSVCLQAYRLEGVPAWGIQFHAEVDRPTLAHWIRDYGSDPDALRTGLDPDALLEESEQALAAWNEAGRGLCGRFLEAAYSGVM